MNSGYAGNHYGGFEQGGYTRDRYPGPSNFGDWRRDGNKEYRNRDYERRPAGPNT